MARSRSGGKEEVAYRVSDRDVSFHMSALRKEAYTTLQQHEMRDSQSDYAINILLTILLDQWCRVLQKATA